MTAPTSERRVPEEFLARYADPSDALSDPVRRDLALDLTETLRIIERRRVHCAYCGEDIIDVRNPASSLAVQEHILQCAKHPAAKIVAEAEAQVATLSTEAERLRDQVATQAKEWYARVADLRTEVERLTKEKAEALSVALELDAEVKRIAMVGGTKSAITARSKLALSGVGMIRPPLDKIRARLAALSLPTPAEPEVKNDQS
jgi:hypothetical protein